MSERRHGRRRSGEERRRLHRRHGERRKDLRVSSDVRLEIEGAGQSWTRRIRNISRGGVELNDPIQCPMGTQLSMTLKFFKASGGIVVKGEVIGVDIQGQGNRIRFAELSEKVRTMLDGHLDLFSAPTRVAEGEQTKQQPTTLEPFQMREALLVVDEEQGPIEHRIDEEERIIGRDPQTADLIINHPSISRRHAQVCVQNDRHVIIDLSSTNGIRFQGKPVHVLVLKNGMVFYLGKVQLQYLKG